MSVAGPTGAFRESMKILISAWACEPGRGSENEVGYRTVVAAATKHEVWAITNPSAVSALQRTLSDRDMNDRIHLHPLEFGVTGDRFEHLGMIGFQRYYDTWQREAARLARDLDANVDFDVVHHVTLSSYWTRAGVAVLGKPLVWGPVGGAVNAPLGLLLELGGRGFVENGARAFARPLLARLPPVNRAQRRARFIFVQNHETASRLRANCQIQVLPNALATEVETSSPEKRRTREIFFVGRLLPWKAATLAVRVLASMENSDAALHVFGNGPERARIERRARSLGVVDRIVFEGWLPRTELFGRLASAGALIHPSLHEEAGMCIAEALALGTPVVCLDRGGPPEIARAWPSELSVCVPPTRLKETARRMATAVDDFLRSPPPIIHSPMSPRRSFQEEILLAYEVAAVGKLASE
jgi:glycosyltransferase involved in cell wall biosynthesis